MKKLAMAVIFMAGIIALAADDPGGYLTAKWGMNQTQVKEALKEKSFKSMMGSKGKMIYYNDMAVATAAMFRFYFSDFDEFYKMDLYPIQKVGSMAGQAMGVDVWGREVIETFRSLETALTEKYGKPNESNKDNLSHFADLDQALIRGQASIIEKWDFEKTIITLQIIRNTPDTAFQDQGFTGNFRPIMIYESKTIKAPENKQKKKSDGLI